MAARRKWRRKLCIGERQFLWYVADDADGMGGVLHLFTPDKRAHALYWLERQRGYPGSAILVAKPGNIVRTSADAPPWEARTQVGPRFVRQVADWLIQRGWSAAESRD